MSPQMPPKRRLFLISGLAIATLCILWFLDASCSERNASPQRLEVPEGFEIKVWAEGLESARAMCLGDQGTLFVGSRSAGKVYALPDADGDFKADEVLTIAEGLQMPVGVAFKNGDLYISAVSEIYVLRDIENRLNNPGSPELITDAFPNETHHGWKFIDFGPDGKLYVPVGAPCNICLEDPETYATILRMNADGTGLETYARGIRNTVGFDWHPVTNELWFTDNGRDWLGDDLPPCELNRAHQKDLHFGYPFCHGDDISDPEFGDQRPCSDFVKPEYNFQAHTAPLGMCFYTGNQFPPSYNNAVFVAQHGSWNRSTKVGYRIMKVELNEAGTEVESAEVFMKGFEKNGEVIGRPVDVLVYTDGSLLISDDYAGKIYQVYYN
jgi:glucose/arabinose dehydrogenase